MEPGGLMPHSQGLSNNSYPEPNQPNYPHAMNLKTRYQNIKMVIFLKNTTELVQYLPCHLYQFLLF